MARRVGMTVSLGGAVVLTLAGCAPGDPPDRPAPASPQIAPDLPVGTSTDISLFTDVPAAPSEAAFLRLGYTVVARDGEVATWRNARTGACAEVTVAGDRITAVEMLRAGSC